MQIQTAVPPSIQGGAAPRRIPPSLPSAVPKGRRAVAILPSPAAEACSTRTRPSIATASTAPAAAARLAVPSPTDVPKAAATPLGPVLPIPACGPGTRARRTGIRVGVLAVALVPTPVPTPPVVPAGITQGTPVLAVGAEVATIVEQVVARRVPVDATASPPLRSGVRPKAVPSNVVLPVAKVVVPRPVGRTNVVRSASADHSNTRSPKWTLSPRTRDTASL